MHVNWHSFWFLETSCDTLDLKLNVKCNLSYTLLISAPFMVYIVDQTINEELNTQNIKDNTKVVLLYSNPQ